jgi:putative OPT family oligopeptide transporter
MLQAPQAVMFAKLVGGIFGAASDLPWHLVGWGALVGVAAILIDRVVLERAGWHFRLHPMPLAVGMYLPWTLTFPILFGGLAYWYAERRLAASGVSEAAAQAAIHRGLLFSSGLVAGEAIMGILIAGLVMLHLEMPLLKGWAEGGLVLDLVSLAALGAMVALLLWITLRRTRG